MLPKLLLLWAGGQLRQLLECLSGALSAAVPVSPDGLHGTLWIRRLHSVQYRAVVRKCAYGHPRAPEGEQNEAVYQSLQGVLHFHQVAVASGFSQNMMEPKVEVCNCRQIAASICLVCLDDDVLQRGHPVAGHSGSGKFRDDPGDSIRSLQERS